MNQIKFGIIVFLLNIFSITGCQNKNQNIIETPKTNHQLARELIQCGHRNIVFSLAHGVQAVTEKEIKKNKIFFISATLVSHKTFVDNESPIIEEQIKKEVMNKIQSATSTKEILTWMEKENKICTKKLRIVMKEVKNIIDNKSSDK